MTDERLTVELVERLMGWTIAPGRYLTGNRCWLPTWRFQPERDLNDAFRLLAAAKPDEYAMVAKKTGGCWCRVRIAGVVAESRDASPAKAIVLAVAQALGINVEAEA